jgi:DNA polymerase-3 subunit delta'
MVLELSHPDLHWFMPVPRPKGGEADKQVEELEETISEVLAERRKDPLYSPADGLAGHFVATARLLQRRAALTPAMARKKVFLLAEADRLVPQESSPEAANALLKLLEEPPADTQLILTVVDPNRLLPTIRSRMVPLRLGRLTDKEVEGFLLQAGKPAEEARRRAMDARGSIGRALSLGEEVAKAEKAADELLRAVASGPQGRAERAMRQGVWAARGDFTAMLDALSGNLSDAARQISGGTPRRPVPEPLLKPRPVEALIEAQARVATARESAQGNVNPQLLLAVLLDDLAEVL